MHRLLIAASALAFAASAAPGSAQVIRDGRWVDPVAPEPTPPPSPPEVAPPTQHAPPPPPEIAVPAPPPAPVVKPREPQVVFAPRNPVVQPVDTVPVAPSSVPSSELPSVADSAPSEPIAPPQQIAEARPGSRGSVLSDEWSDPRFVVRDYARWRLPEPGPDEHWIRQYDDAVLVDRAGRVADRIANVDWNAVPRGYAARDRDARYDDAYAQVPDEPYGTSYPPPRGDAGYRGPEYRYPAPGRRYAGHPSQRRPSPPPQVTVDGCEQRCNGTHVETYYSGSGYISGGYYYPPATTTVVTIEPATTTTTERWDDRESAPVRQSRRYDYRPRRKRVQRIR